ncbi:MAG: DUF2239 family protein [Proteobacteria bacterium]|nr:DUF2239 family protein [Pseudomonadota bacterium]
MAAAESQFVAFAGSERIAFGPLGEVALAVRRRRDADPHASLLVFGRESGQVVDLDLRGDAAEIAARYAPAAAARRGRPKLGVTAREVTLLPRHWDWLARQPGGASVTLRRLVEAAAKAEAPGGDARARTEAAYRFMSAMGGDLPGFEEAARALFANDRTGLADRLAGWPADIAAETLAILEG